MNSINQPSNTEARIRLMPEALANQIAAGEVVQRPASVVKELMENALDAGSKRLILQLREAGKNLIQLTDDGSGMSPLDARMAFERHATSKLFSLDDLFRVRTMGFRGEALASIAAVAQVEMRTRLHTQEVGTLVRIEGGRFLAQESCVTPPGTSIAVHNLFFNVPARRNFLKSNPVELRHAHQEFVRLALAHPLIQFEFYHNGHAQHILAPSSAQERISTLLSLPVDYLIPLKSADDFLGIEGWIFSPQSSRSFKNEQYFWVNGRYIRSTYLNHAVARAYESVMQSVEQPTFFIHLTTDPKNIDINIHPNKTEIKFSEESRCYQLVFQAIRQALSQKLNYGATVQAKNLARKDKTSSVFTPHLKSDEGIFVRPVRDVQTSPHWLSRSTSGDQQEKKNATRTWQTPIAGGSATNLHQHVPLFDVQRVQVQQLNSDLVWVYHEHESWLVAYQRIGRLFHQLPEANPDVLNDRQVEVGMLVDHPLIRLNPVDVLAWPHIEPALLNLGVRAVIKDSGHVQILAQPEGTDVLKEIQNRLAEFYAEIPSQTAEEFESKPPPKLMQPKSLVHIWLKLGKPTHDATGLRLALELDSQICSQLFETFF